MNSVQRTTCPPEILKWTYPAFLAEMRRRQTERELDELTTPFVPYYCMPQEERPQ